jgi:hypothetical protein
MILPRYANFYEYWRGLYQILMMGTYAPDQRGGPTQGARS